MQKEKECTKHVKINKCVLIYIYVSISMTFVIYFFLVLSFVPDITRSKKFQTKISNSRINQLRQCRRNIETESEGPIRRNSSINY